MSLKTDVMVYQSDEAATLAIQTRNFYAMFQSFPDGGVLGKDAALYVYGRIEPRTIPEAELAPGEAQPTAWLMERTYDDGRLLPGYESRLSESWPGNVLVVAEDQVEDVLSRFNTVQTGEDWPPSQLPAEKLYRRLAGKLVNQEVIEACAVYNLTSETPRITYVHRLGAYSIGVPSSEGIARDIDLIATKRADALHGGGQSGRIPAI